jgi:hypothetical protein
MTESAMSNPVGRQPTIDNLPSNVKQLVLRQGWLMWAEDGAGSCIALAFVPNSDAVAGVLAPTNG